MYSQQNEEALILAAFSDPRHTRRFLDIGAWDPKTFSNTRALYEIGWRGVLIEPSPGPLRNLVKEYGEVEGMRVISAAVTLDGGLVEMVVTDDAVSADARQQARVDEWKATGGFYGKLTVPSITPLQIANQFGGFDFISLDTEGTSVDLFRNMMELGWRPRCWCVEIDGRAAELAAIAEGAGYRSAEDLAFGVLGNGTNAIFVKK